MRTLLFMRDVAYVIMHQLMALDNVCDVR